MRLKKTKTPVTETEIVNPNPAEEVSGAEPIAETMGTPEPTATVAAEPEQYVCHEGCGFVGPVGAFKAPDLKNVVVAFRAVIGQKTGRVTIPTEYMAAHATCEKCAERVSAERGVVYWPLQWGLDRVIAKLTKQEQAAPVADDPEAQVLVACCVCEAQIARADAKVIGWWGAKLLANRILGRDGGLASNHEANRMLVNNTGIGEGAEKCPAVCRDCVDITRPRLVEMAAQQEFVQRKDDEERRKEFSYQLKPMPLMVAIRKAREYEARGAAMVAEEQAKVKHVAALTAKLEAFLGSAAGRKSHNGGGKGGKDNGRGERGGGNRGRWSNNND